MIVGVMKSTMDYERAQMECFARLELGKGMIIEYYSGKLMYTSLYDYKKFR